MNIPLQDESIAVESNEIARGWRSLVACSIGIGLGMSAMFMFTLGVFAVALEREFGWGRGEIMAAAMFDTLAVLLVGPFVGRLIDRIGARPVALASVFGIGAATVALSLTQSELWVYYLLYAVRSAVSVGTLPPTFAKVISTHFDRQRGLALGIALCTTGISAMLLPPYVQTLIDGFGWRVAFVGLGLLPLAVSLPVIWLLLPRDRGTVSVNGAARSHDLPGREVKEAVRNWRFWLMGALALSAGIGLGGLIANLVPLLVDRGFAPSLAAAMMSIYGLAIIGGRIVSGYLLDRIWAPAVGCAFLLFPTIGTLMLAGGVQSVGLVALTVVMVALASGAEFDLVAFLTGRYFGQRNFSTLYSMQYAFFAVGAGSAPSIYGFVHDWTGSYTSILYLAAILFGWSAAAILALGPYPVFRRQTA